jgi:hypothetical protein
MWYDLERIWRDGTRVNPGQKDADP